MKISEICNLSHNLSSKRNQLKVKHSKPRKPLNSLTNFIHYPKEIYDNKCKTFCIRNKLMVNIVSHCLRPRRHEILASVLQSVLVLGDLQSFPFVLEGGFGILRHLPGCVKAHLVLHGLGLISSWKAGNFINKFTSKGSLHSPLFSPKTRV